MTALPRPTPWSTRLQLRPETGRLAQPIPGAVLAGFIRKKGEGCITLNGSNFSPSLSYDIESLTTRYSPVSRFGPNALGPILLTRPIWTQCRFPPVKHDALALTVNPDKSVR